MHSKGVSIPIIFVFIFLRINVLRFVLCVYLFHNFTYDEDMDAQDYSGNTPLHLTVENDAFDAMDYLLSM